MKEVPVHESEICLIDQSEILLNEQCGGDLQKVDIRYHMVGLLAYFCYHPKGLMGDDLRVVRGITRLVLKELGEIPKE